MTIRKSLNEPLRKDDRLVYIGKRHRYSAVITRAHRDGTFTVKLGFRLDEHNEPEGFYQGDLVRIEADDYEHIWR